MAQQNQTILVQDEPRGPSQLIELAVPAQVTSVVNFPTIQNLQSQSDQIVIIKAIRLIPDSILTKGPLLGFTNAPLTELVKCSLVLYSQQWIKGQLIPLLTLVDTYTEGSGIPFRFKTTKFDNWRDVDWSKSFIQYSNGQQSSGTAYQFVFEVEYQKFIRLADGSMGNEITTVM